MYDFVLGLLKNIIKTNSYFVIPAHYEIETPAHPMD